MVLKTLGSVFGPESIQIKSYVGIDLHYLDQLDLSEAQLMTLALNARLGAQVVDPVEVVRLLYTNMVGAAPDPQTLNGFAAMLQSGQHTPTSSAMMASQTELNLAGVGLIGTVTVPIEYVVPTA